MFITGLGKKRLKPQHQPGDTGLSHAEEERYSTRLSHHIGKDPPKTLLWYQTAILVPCHWGPLSNVPIQVPCSPGTSAEWLPGFWAEIQDFYSSPGCDGDKTLAMLRSRLEEQKSSGGQEEYPKEPHPKGTKKKSHEVSRYMIQKVFLEEEWDRAESQGLRGLGLSLWGKAQQGGFLKDRRGVLGNWLEAYF